jgi:transcriptional regulator with XRE-family HTH domain
MASSSDGLVRTDVLVRRTTSHLAEQLRMERLRRGLTIRDLASRVGLSPAAVYAVETGRTASLPTYIALGSALHLQPAFTFEARQRRAIVQPEDPVHAAMGELEARRLRSLGNHVAVASPTSTTSSVAEPMSLRGGERLRRSSTSRTGPGSRMLGTSRVRGTPSGPISHEFWATGLGCLAGSDL